MVRCNTVARFSGPPACAGGAASRRSAVISHPCQVAAFGLQELVDGLLALWTEVTGILLSGGPAGTVRLLSGGYLAFPIEFPGTLLGGNSCHESESLVARFLRRRLAGWVESKGLSRPTSTNTRIEERLLDPPRGKGNFGVNCHDGRLALRYVW